MIDLLDTQKYLITPHIHAGGTVVDFTMGNGHDTLWLSQMVGDAGKVYAFDIQQAALDSTAARLAEHDCTNVTLIKDSHSNVKTYVKEPICAGLFNLGYLPGGDRSITTMRETTLPAIRAAIELLEAGGGLLIAVYPGHAEGTAEGIEVTQLLSEYDRRQMSCTQVRLVNSPTSPFFFLVEKR